MFEKGATYLRVKFGMRYVEIFFLCCLLFCLMIFLSIVFDLRSKALFKLTSHLKNGVGGISNCHTNSETMLAGVPFHGPCTTCRVGYSISTNFIAFFLLR